MDLQFFVELAQAPNRATLSLDQMLGLRIRASCAKPHDVAANCFFMAFLRFRVSAALRTKFEMNLAVLSILSGS